MNFLLRDANCGLIVKFNPIYLEQSSKNWVSETLFSGSIPNILSQRKRKKEIVIFRRQKLSEIQTELEANGFCFVDRSSLNLMTAKARGVGIAFFSGAGE